MPGKLYLIPNTLGDPDIASVIPPLVANTACRLRYFIVENERSARRYLRSLDKEMDIDGSVFFVLDKHIEEYNFDRFLSPVKNGHDIGVISEAGCPGVADPGAEVVKAAHKKNIEVVPLTGPSSILLALMGSGMNGQNFAFNGYLPIKKGEREKKIRQLEARCQKEKQTQLFIEAPYRNNALAKDLIETCKSQTIIGIACNLTLPDGFVKSRPAREWKSQLPDLHKKPTIFMLGVVPK